MSMAVIVPSRGRPQNIERLLDDWQETQAIAELHVVVDDDDPELENYQAVMHPQLPRFQHMPLGWRAPQLWVGPRRRLGGSLNHLAPHLAKYVDIVGFMGDDHRPRTARWDRGFIGDAMPLGGVAYGNDLIQGPNLPTAVFMDSRIVRVLGWFVVPGMTHLFMDNLWKTLGEQLGTLRYLPDVIIEHVHPIAGRAEWDQTYVEANDGQVWEHDEAIYKEWMAFQMGADIAKIRAALNPGGL